MTTPLYTPARAIGNGATSVYPFTFPVQATSQLKVTVRDTDGNDEVLVLGSSDDYTATLLGDGTGSITLVDGALTTDYLITIERVVPLTQTTAFSGHQSFYGAAHDAAHDKAMRAIQQINEALGRGIVLPVHEDAADYSLELPLEADRAGKFLACDADGDITAVAALDVSEAAITAYGESLIEAANAGAAQTVLGFSAYMKTLVDAANAAALRTLLGLGGTSATIVSGDLTSATVPKLFQARPTLATATPVTTADQTGKTVIFLTPYGGDQIALYSGTRWDLYSLSEIQIAVPATTNQMYDLFVWNNAGTLTLEAVAWTDDTTRATALTTQNGVLVKTGDTTRRYVGSFRTTGVSGQTEDSKAKRFLWSYYNRVPRLMSVVETTDTWTYTTASFRQANAGAANQLDFIIGVAEVLVSADVLATASTAIGDALDAFAVGIGLDSTTVSTAKLMAPAKALVSGKFQPITAQYKEYVAVGRHFLAWLEIALVSTTTFYGDVGAGYMQSGIHGELLG